MNMISCEELKTRLDRQEPVCVIMVLSSWAYGQLHIPGSVGVDALSGLVESQAYDREVIVYDTNPACPASYRAYYRLIALGFRHVQCFAGGIEAWVEAGYPVEGSLAGEPRWPTA